MGSKRIVVIGAGIGGLTAALDLARQGLAVTLLERAATPGGKMRQTHVDDLRIDAGPTVLTMRWVFDELFAQAGSSLASQLSLRPAGVLARHAWAADGHLDLYADLQRSAEAIGDFAGAGEARRYLEFSLRARRIYETLERPFIRSSCASPQALVRAVGPRGLGDLWRISPFASLWRALGDHFKDPRLRQLFGRYATYCGSSPFEAPATLMLVAHVEREGVWFVDGGMHRLAQALAGLAARHGVCIRYGAECREIAVRKSQVTGVRLAGGEWIEADAVIANADPAAIGAGLFGADAARATPKLATRARSLSAVTWALKASVRGFPLHRHNVFFSSDYAAEFRDIFERSKLPAAPTVYVCAQDRDDAVFDTDIKGPERLLCLINAPPTGDHHAFDSPEIASCELRTFMLLERCGLQLDRRPDWTRITTPADFHQLFPGTGGALYGPASHGWTASFNRPGARSRIPGLYLAGGSTHPGPGVPMAALSGRIAAASLIEDLARASTASFRTTVTSGGISMR